MPNYYSKEYQGRDSHGRFDTGIKGGPTHAQYAGRSFGNPSHGWAVHGSSVARVHGSPRVPRDLDIVATPEVWNQIAAHPSTYPARWNRNVLYSSEFKGEIGKTREGGGLDIPNKAVENPENVRERWATQTRGTTGPYVGLGEYQREKARVARGQGRISGRAKQSDLTDLEWIDHTMRVEKNRRNLRRATTAAGLIVGGRAIGRVARGPTGPVGPSWNTIPRQLAVRTGTAWSPMTHTRMT